MKSYLLFIGLLFSVSMQAYYSISPYVWCGNNPVRFVDPEGRKIHIASSLASRILGKVGVNTYHAKVSRDISRLKQMDPQIQTMIVVLEKSENTYTITPVSDRPDKKNGNAYDHNTNTLYYDPDNPKRLDGEVRDPIVGLAHELGHAENDETGERIEYDQDKVQEGDVEEKKKKNQNEQNSIQKENIVREELNLPLRDETYTK